MSQLGPPQDFPAVLAGPGLPILEAGRWVGDACWRELRLVELITTWLAIETDPAISLELWDARSEAAQRAEMWFHRLPMLSEFPRSGFIAALDTDEVARFDKRSQLSDQHAGSSRKDVLGEILGELRERYEAHRAVANGPADGPTSWALGEALRSL